MRLLVYTIVFKYQCVVNVLIEFFSILFTDIKTAISLWYGDEERSILITFIASSLQN